MFKGYFPMGGGVNFLGIALACEFPYGIRPKQNLVEVASKMFASEARELSRTLRVALALQPYGPKIANAQFQRSKVGNGKRHFRSKMASSTVFWEARSVEQT